MAQTQTPQDWLTEQFEYEYCAECGGDAQHHTVCSGPFGLYFAHCDYPPTAETNWEQHPVIAAFHAQKDS